MTVADQDRRVRRFEQIVGNSPALRVVLEQAERVAATDATVPHSGRDRHRQGTHRSRDPQCEHSQRPPSDQAELCRDFPSTCSRVSSLGTSGAPSRGAIAQKVGRFELADKGTLFLDEIGDIPLALQPKLLRVLQEQDFERLGVGVLIAFDVRLLAAITRTSNECEAQRVSQRLDYRLNVFPITLPPLRDHAKTLLHWWNTTLNTLLSNGKSIHTIPEEFVSACKAYSWPGKHSRASERDRTRRNTIE